MSVLTAFFAALVPLAPLAAAPTTAEPLTLVACAPGYPGSTGEAQPVMDAFAAAVAEAAGWERGSLRAEYYEDEARGLERARKPDVAFVIAPLPFVLKHEAALRLVPEAQVAAEGGRSEETWSLVAAKGKVPGPAALDGFELMTSAGYAPRFVRGTALGAWGGTAGARIVTTAAVLSGLRRAAGGEKIALLLDSAETAALPTLTFAKDLEVVSHSSPLPATLFCSAGGRATPGKVKEAVKALLDLQRRPSGAVAMSAMRMEGFVPLQADDFRRARAAYAAAKDTP